MRLLISSHTYGDQWVYFDDIDKDLIMRYRWGIQRKKNGKMYATAKKNKLTIFMHSYLLNDLNIDHINGDGLDNRRCNLRKATPVQNSYNRGANKNNTTGFKGVSRLGIKYTAQIHFNRKKLHIGVFDKIEDAAKAYDKKAIELFGEYAQLNFCNKKDFPDPQDHSEFFQSEIISETGYYGVYKEREQLTGKMFFSKIKVNGCMKYLGWFYDAKEAAVAYNNALDKYLLDRPRNII